MEVTRIQGTVAERIKREKALADLESVTAQVELTAMLTDTLIIPDEEDNDGGEL